MVELGLLYTLRGEFGQALELNQSALKMASDHEHREWIVGNQFLLGILYIEKLAPIKAQQELEEGLAMAQELGSQYWINLVVGSLTKVYIMIGEFSEAQECLNIAINSETPMDTTGKRYCWARRAELALAQRDVTKVLDITERLITSAAGLEPGLVITFLWMLKAEAFTELGRIEEAVHLLQAAIENAERFRERFLLWRLHGSLSRLYKQTGRDEEAEKEILLAHELIEEMAATISDKEFDRARPPSRH